jgi:hypothetical protein
VPDEPEIETGELVTVDLATASPWEAGGSEYVVMLRGRLDDRWIESYVLTRRRSPRFSRFHLNRSRSRVTFLCRESEESAPLQEILEDLKLLVRETNRRAALPSHDSDALEAGPAAKVQAPPEAPSGDDLEAQTPQPPTTERSGGGGLPRLGEALGLAIRLLEEEPGRCARPADLARLLGTAALVLEEGGTDDEVIAALFARDEPPESPSKERLGEIGARFGSRVAQLVEACEEGHSILKRGGDSRLHSLFFRHTSPAVRRIVSASKLRGARALLCCYRKLDLEQRLNFREENDPMLQYYRSLVESVLEAGQSSHLINDLDGVVLEMELAAGPSIAERRQKRPIDRFTDEVVNKLELRLES